MFTLHVQGLSLCVFDSKNDRLRVCCLNSAFKQTNRIPIHLQTLVAAKSSVDTRATTVPALASVLGRLRLPFADATHAAWDFSGRRVTVAGGDGHGGLPRRHDPKLKIHHPDPKNPDYSPLHWVLSADRYLPKAKLRAEALEIGPMTSALVDVTGGECVGGEPDTIPNDKKFVFKFTQKLDQAVTDTMDVRFDKPPLIRFLAADGAEVGTVAFKDGSEAFLINEATDNDIFNEKRAFPGDKERGRHLRGYWAVFDNLPRQLKLPKRGKQWLRGRQPIIDVTFCVVMRA